jgi:hypothetical protein
VTEKKKYFDERLQEVRSKNQNKLRYQKRKQQEQEADEELKEYENRKPES